MSRIQSGQIRTSQEANKQLGIYEDVAHRIEADGAALNALAAQRLGKPARGRRNARGFQPVLAQQSQRIDVRIERTVLGVGLRVQSCVEILKQARIRRWPCAKGRQPRMDEKNRNPGRRGCIPK